VIGGRTLRKLVLLGASTTLIVGSLGLGFASAADTRDITVGDPSSSSSVLLPTTQKGTTDDAAAWFLIRVQNKVGSTLTQVVLTVTLPDDIELLAVFGPSGTWPCTGTSTVVCSLPNIAGDSPSPTLTFVVHGDQVGTYSGLTASVSLKEGNGSNNADNFQTNVVPIHVEAGSGDDVTRWTAPSNQSTPFELNDAGNGQTTKLILPPSRTGYVVAVVESASNPGCDFSQSGSEFPITYGAVNSGTLISPYLEWTVSSLWAVTPPPTKKQLSGMGVLHCNEQSANEYVVEVISDRCSKDVDPPCIVDAKYDSKSKYVTITFRTLTNGYVKGYR